MTRFAWFDSSDLYRIAPRCSACEFDSLYRQADTYVLVMVQCLIGTSDYLGDPMCHDRVLLVLQSIVIHTCEHDIS